MDVSSTSSESSSSSSESESEREYDDDDDGVGHRVERGKPMSRTGGKREKEGREKKKRK